jgi:hypothetical protein
VQDTDAGVIIKLEQVRGQVEGGVAQGLASTRWPLRRPTRWPTPPEIRFRDLPLTPERIFGPLVADGGRSRPPE